jgi:hypothetical protein
MGPTGTGTLELEGTLTLNNGLVTAVPAWLVAGTLNMYSGAVFNNSVGLATAVNITNFRVYNGATYNHDAIGTTGGGAATDFPGVSRTFGASSNVVLLSGVQVQVMEVHYQTIWVM